MSDNSNISSELGKTTSTAPSVLVQEGGYQLAPISFYPLAGLVLSDGSIDWQAADQSDDPVDTITITKTAGSGTFSTTRILHDSNIASDVTVSSDGNTITYVGSLSNFTKYFEQELGYGVYAQVPETDDFTVSISNSYGTASATTSIVIDSNIDAAQAFISTQPSFSVSDTAGLASSIGGLYRLTTSNLGTSGLSTTQTATLTLSIDTVTAGVGGTLEAISLPSDATVSGNGTTTIAVTGTEAELATILQNDIYFVGNSGSTLLKTDEAQIQTTLTLQETGSSVVQSIGQTLMEYGTLLPFSMAVSAVSPTGSSSASGGSYGLTQSNATYALFPSSTYGVTFTNATGEVSVSLVNSNTAAGTLDLSAASNTGLVGSVSNTTDGTAQTVTATFDNATDATAFLDTAVFDIAQGSAAEGQVTTVTLDASNVSSGVTATAFSENLTVIPTTAPALSGLPASSDPSDAANTPFASAVVTSPGDLPVTVTVTVADAAGTLSSGTASDLTVSGSGSGTLTLKGDVADVQAALRAVTFTATAGLETAETVSFSTSVTNGYTSSTATASTIVEPGLSFSAPATADSLSALLQGVNLSDASATSVTLTVQETSGSGTLSVAADSALNATVSTDGKTVTVTGTVAELTAELASGAITATDPSVMVDSESGNATFSLTASDGSTTVSASSTVSVAGSATFLTSGNTITTSNNADVSVALTNTAAGTFINAGASTLTLKNDNAGSNGTTVTMSGNGIVDATETGTSGDSFIMGADGGSNTLNIANTGSGSTTVTADGKTQTVNAADSTSQVVVFGSASQVNYTGGTGLLVSNGAGNTTDWTITGVSGGSNQVWLGNSDVTINAGGANQVILGNGAGLNGSVSITGGSSSDTEEVDL
ncbi:beta strand repeat-containing protein, partial [Acetobacter conturbans]